METSAVTVFKDVFQGLAAVTTIAAATVALGWFFFTKSFRQRIQFDVDLQIIDVGDPQDFAAEVMLIVDNKGQREHRMYNLFCEVRQSRLFANSSAALKSYHPLENLVPEKLEYYFVAAGVRQPVTSAFKIPKSEKLVRVKALFAYHQVVLPVTSLDAEPLAKLDREADIHTVARLFEVKPRPFSTQ